MLKKVLFGAVLIVAIWALFHGIKLQDPAEVENNGNLICLSCMGLEG